MGIIELSVYFLALINPASKVLLLSSVRPKFDKKDLFVLSLKATIASLVILVIMSLSGKFLLLVVFRVEMYSLRIAGGIILFFIGVSAVKKGRFYESDISKQSGHDISVVPLAAPLIAGPGTITAAISYAGEYGFALTAISFSIALVMNLVIMNMSLFIGNVMDKLNFAGPLIRITGLIVAAVAVQLCLTGTAEWASGFLPR